MIFQNNNNLKEDDEYYYFYNMTYRSKINSSISFLTLKYIFEENNFAQYASLKMLIASNVSLPDPINNYLWEGKVAKSEIHSKNVNNGAINCSYKKISQGKIKKLMMLL